MTEILSLMLAADDAEEFPDVQDGFSSEPTGRQPRAGLEQLFEINIHDQAAGQAPNRSGLIIFQYLLISQFIEYSGNYFHSCVLQMKLLST